MSVAVIIIVALCVYIQVLLGSSQLKSKNMGSVGLFGRNTEDICYTIKATFNLDSYGQLTPIFFLKASPNFGEHPDFRDKSYSPNFGQN